MPDSSSGTHTERICRTVHGPVQEVVEGEGIAYSRRYAIWKREVGTIAGLDAVNRASSIEDVDAAADLLTWNENLMAADDRGNIGFWNPGLLPVRSKRWDERLPFPDETNLDRAFADFGEGKTRIGCGRREAGERAREQGARVDRK